MTDEGLTHLHVAGQGVSSWFGWIPVRSRARAGVMGAMLILALVVIAGRLVFCTAVATDFSAKMLAPSYTHPFGTDQMGRDMLARTLAGLSTSLCVGALVAVFTVVIACVMAFVSVAGGRWGDAVVRLLTDTVMGVPHIVALILISYALGRGLWGVVIGLSLTHWPSLARILTTELLQIRRERYMDASAALGVAGVTMFARHLFPAIFPQLLVGALLSFSHAILHEASMTFLGFGLSPEVPALGTILAESMGYLSAGAWWLAVLPGVSLVACVLLLDGAGSACRQAIDARVDRGAKGAAA